MNWFFKKKLKSSNVLELHAYIFGKKRYFYSLEALMDLSKHLTKSLDRSQIFR